MPCAIRSALLTIATAFTTRPRPSGPSSSSFLRSATAALLTRVEEGNKTQVLRDFSTGRRLRHTVSRTVLGVIDPPGVPPRLGRGWEEAPNRSIIQPWTV